MQVMAARAPARTGDEVNIEQRTEQRNEPTALDSGSFALAATLPRFNAAAKLFSCATCTGLQVPA